jgi:nucleoside 2-deoxyribosyltransferase
VELDRVCDSLRRAGLSAEMLHSEQAESDLHTEFQIFKNHYECLARDASVIANECAGVVLCLNGRTPDEGAVFRAALAYALGLPVVLFKHDCRSAFHGQDNAMITGLSWPQFESVPRVEELAAAIRRALDSGAPEGARAELAPVIARLAGQGAAPAGDAAPVGPLSEQDIARGNGITFTLDAPRPPVYLSGPLFSPAEVLEMQSMASALHNGPDFLPHRDGAERFVMNQVDSPAANLWFLSPVRQRINRAIFDLDIYQIAQRCGVLVANMNGRVPDDGMVVETAVALALGVPVLLYVNDPDAARRSPLVAALGRLLPVVRDLDHVNAGVNLLLKDEEGRLRQSERPSLPANVAAVAARGARVWRFVQKMDFMKPAKVMGVPVAEPGGFLK